jgi:exopolysaccharide production protein ExoY
MAVLREEASSGILSTFAPGSPAVVLPLVPTVGQAGWPGKRMLDVAGALVLLVLLAPVMLLAALAVKLSSPGPVFFRQPRIGRGGREFPIIKFRTMCKDAEERLQHDSGLRGLYFNGDHKIPCRLDPRVTPVGRVFRTWSIDELPQLFNVIAGHMSLVGPRPVELSQVGSYAERMDAYLSMRPGLTGIWQTSGRSGIPFPARAELDAWYQERCTLWLDLKILAKTPLSVLRREGSD